MFARLAPWAMMSAAALLPPALAIAQGQPPVTPGGWRVEGGLTADSPVLDDGSFYQCHPLNARDGQILRITMTSPTIDSYLWVGHGAFCADMAVARYDDDSVGDLDAQMVVRVGEGQWWVRANSLDTGETGPYTLEAELIPTVDGDEMRRASGGRDVIRMGQAISDSLEAQLSRNPAGAYLRCYDFTASGSMVTEIALQSADFDSYLTLKAGACPGGRVIAENDDYGDTLDSRIRRRLPPGPYAIEVGAVENRPPATISSAFRSAR